MQNLVIRCLEPERIASVAARFRPHLMAEAPTPERWPLSAHYPTTLRISPLRQDLDGGPDFSRYWPTKRSDGGRRLEFEWLLIADEHDRLDPRLACFFSQELTTTSFALHASDGTDEYGFGCYTRGELVEAFFREMEERPVYRITEELEYRGIPYQLRRFRDCSGPGWSTVRLDPE